MVIAMTKREFWKKLEADQKQSMADEVGSTTAYLRQVFMYGRHTGAKKARQLAALTGGVVGAHEFCPEAYSELDCLSDDSEGRLAS